MIASFVKKFIEICTWKINNRGSFWSKDLIVIATFKSVFLLVWSEHPYFLPTISQLFDDFFHLEITFLSDSYICKNKKKNLNFKLSNAWIFHENYLWNLKIPYSRVHHLAVNFDWSSADKFPQILPQNFPTEFNSQMLQIALRVSFFSSKRLFFPHVIWFYWG